MQVSGKQIYFSLDLKYICILYLYRPMYYSPVLNVMIFASWLHSLIVLFPILRYKIYLSFIFVTICVVLESIHQILKIFSSSSRYSRYQQYTLCQGPYSLYLLLLYSTAEVLQVIPSTRTIRNTQLLRCALTESISYTTVFLIIT